MKKFLVLSFLTLLIFTGFENSAAAYDLITALDKIDGIR